MLIVKLNGHAVDPVHADVAGVPLIVVDKPVCATSNVNPGGKPFCPVCVVTDHLYGPVPPSATIGAEYACPTIAPGSVVVVIESPAVTLIVSDFVAV
jgi:hypothetical protein